MSTFVSVGNANQPFVRLLDAVAQIADKLPQPVVVQRGHTPFECTCCDVVAFVDMQKFAELVENAELLIFHAGAGSIIHAVLAGKSPVVMPRLAKFGEHVNDHQLEFSEAMAAEGKIILARDVGDLECAVDQALARGAQKNSAANQPYMVTLVASELAHYAERLKK